MTFFRDLSPFRYFEKPELENALNVGWLSPFRYCPIGLTTREFRRKLFDLCASPQVRARGYHPCLLGICKFTPRRFGTPASLDGRLLSLGSGIVVVRGTADTYAAPDLIYHYVTRHWYRPPKGFIDAVLQAPSDARPDRTFPVFFYGLFMDADALVLKGLHPENVRLAAVPGYTIRIGNRATLVREPGSSAYGVLMDLPRNEIDALYSGPGLEAYRPEPVVADTGGGARVSAVCFNLVTPPAPGEANREYAEQLRELARRLGLPPDYIEQIR